jgi:hypothetical protein
MGAKVIVSGGSFPILKIVGFSNRRVGEIHQQESENGGSKGLHALNNVE